MARFRRNAVFIPILLGLLASHEAFAGSSPRLYLITPRGVQRGHEHVMRFSGERLSETMQVFLYEPGVEVFEITQLDDNTVEARISVAADCRLGEHVGQIRTARGISDFQTFQVGPNPELNETEPNNAPDQAQRVEPGVTINGVITNEDVDLFRVAAKQGQRLSVEIEAMRLGYFFDPFIAVFNEQNFELALSDDSSLHGQDGLLSLIIPKDGDYFVLVRETSYGGDDNCRYRLHVGSFPRPLVAWPAAGPPGMDLEILFLGDPSGPIQRSENVATASAGLMIEQDGMLSPSMMPFRVSALTSHRETEANNDLAGNELQGVIMLPGAIDGIVAEPGDLDCFKFQATTGQAIDIECFARRVGSGLDPVIDVFNAAGQHIVGDDDARRPDSYLRFNVPADGQYVVRVRDHLDRGQADFVYRLELTPAAPSLAISIPKVDRYSQFRQQISVAQGNRFATLISAERANFGGQLELLAADLPPGMTMESRPMDVNMNLMPVVFTATAEAPLAGQLFDLKARHVATDTNISGSFELVGDFSRGQPNDTFYDQCRVDKLACAITRRLPFRIELVQPKVPLVRDGIMYLRIVATRDEGFDAPISIEFPFRPPGLGTHPSIQIDQGKNEALYEINANGSAQLGTWPIYAIGSANVEGPAFASTQLAELQIAEPFVTGELTRASCVQGQTATIHCKLNHRVGFEGGATAQILGLPPNIDVPTLTFTTETPELTFAATTNSQSPIGNHKSLFCRVTIMEHGEPIVFTAALSELQIIAPVQAVEPAANATPVDSGPPEPAAQPKSRLQLLRDSARSRRGH